MTKLLSLRVKPGLLARIDSRSVELGNNRSEYILGLVERDLEFAEHQRGHRFGSDDLVGAFQTGLPLGDNATVRSVVRGRLKDANR
jgi:hypothetical protein